VVQKETNLNFINQAFGSRLRFRIYLETVFVCLCELVEIVCIKFHLFFFFLTYFGENIRTILLEFPAILS
jgi:hypothetical protein